MIIKSLLDMLKTIVLFVCFTVFFYFALLWLNEEYQSYQQYEEPSGEAIPVDEKGIHTEDTTTVERLIQFYQTGE